MIDVASFKPESARKPEFWRTACVSGPVLLFAFDAGTVTGPLTQAVRQNSGSQIDRGLDGPDDILSL